MYETVSIEKIQLQNMVTQLTLEVSQRQQAQQRFEVNII